MRLHQRFLTILLSIALVPSAALIANAQNDDQEGDVSGPPPNADVQSPSADGQSPADNQPDPPARAARLQFMSGSVSVQPHGTDEWVAGALNRPLTNSDNVWADKNSRAEISVGAGLIRLDSESSLTLTNIDENTVQLQLHQGAMNLHVRRLYDNEHYEVDTPNQAFTVLKPGDYRFDVDSDADKTVVTVWRGEGDSTGNQGSAVRIRENQQAKFADGESVQAADLHQAPRLDDFDQWAQSRDERFDHSASARYVSPDVVGSDDLDEYGTWRNTPDYGQVWTPRVDVGWAPYRNGHWIWVAPWGWTWVEDEPWGYAPFHYGRWVYYNNFWGWAPGPIYVRPYYAPALVAWFGGPGWGVSVGFGGGFGGYGWCPLGFGEPYLPWYGVSRGYFNRVNITNTHITNVNITNVYNNTYINNHPGRPGQPGHPGQPGQPGYPPTGGGGGPYGPHNNIRYANMHAPNGFTAVSRQTLMNSQPVARNAMRISPNQLSRVSPVHSLDVKPTRAAMLGQNAGMRAAAPPPRSFTRPVVSRMATPSGMRANSGTNAGMGGGRPGFGVGAQRPTQTMNTQRPSGPMNNAAVQRPIANNGGVQRPMSMPDHRGVGIGAPANNNMRVAERGAMSPRSVPRPPSAGSFGAGPRNNSGPAAGMRPGMDNTPRSNVSRPSMGADMNRGGGPAVRTQPQSIPRPSSASPSYQAGNRGFGSGPYNRPEPNNGSYGRPAPNNGTYNRESPSYSRPQSTYGRPMPNNGGGSYSRPAPNYSGSYGRPTPSVDRGGYSGPAPSYGRGSAARSMPSYGGGSSGRSMPSYGGGGRAPSYGGGGGRSSGSSGGGGHASAAPSHGGGSGNGGGGHGGRH